MSYYKQKDILKGIRDQTFMNKVCALYGMIVCRSTDDCSKSVRTFMTTKLPSQVLGL